MKDEDDVIRMLKAYFDESGTHQDSKVLAFGGYISTVKKWRSFEKQWQKMLDTEQIPMMHSTDLESRHGAFKNWSIERKVRVQKQAISIIRRNVLQGFSSSVILDDYQTIVAGKPHIKFTSPYTFAMTATLHLVKKWVKDNNIKIPIHYVFESGAGYAGEITDVMKQTKNIGWDFYRMKSANSWSFADKIDFIPLQSADILAYEAYKQMLNFKVGETRRDLRKSAESLLRSVPHDDHFFDEQTLLKLIAFLGLD